MTTVFIIITSVYVLLIASFIVGFKKVNYFNETTNSPKTSFSIVIPFRNEVNNLEILLKSLYNQNYPKELYEILLVNDASTDNSVGIINAFKSEHPTINLTVLQIERHSNSPKKDAISTAINHSKFNWIVTTDADCETPINWLKTFDSFIISKKPNFISAPVSFFDDDSILYQFQKLNLLSLIGATIGAFGIQKPFLCNGANLCYRKDTFLALKGFTNNDEIASGDDIFLLEKFTEKYPNKTLFLKSRNSIVKTKSEKSVASFVNQQLRWASKSKAYKNPYSKLVGSVIFLMNILVLLYLCYILVYPKNWIIFGIGFLLKLCVDIIIMQKTAHFLERKIEFKYYIVASSIYPFFILYIAALTTFKKYTWKGRKFKH